MTTESKIARRKLSLLELASDMANVSRACRIIGYSRQQFYEIRRNYQTYGSKGLLDRFPGPKGPHPNRVSEIIEKAILEHCLHNPTHGCIRVSQELQLKGTNVSSGGVRGVWVVSRLFRTFFSVQILLLIYYSSLCLMTASVSGCFLH
jgi:hypothetical protein